MLRYSIYEEFTLFVITLECFYAKIQNSQQTFFSSLTYTAQLFSYFEELFFSYFEVNWIL